MNIRTILNDLWNQTDKREEEEFREWIRDTPLDGYLIFSDPAEAREWALKNTDLEEAEA